ncbi:MAG: hypothetical protein N3A69_02225, partial [Leptospiraceae bacterium]|nr:hypothetical protein [Leptospiraceae bacterium]
LYRVEVDTDHDGYPDHFGESESETELRRMTKENGLKPLAREKSWVLNPSLVPKIYSAIIQLEN